MKPSLRTVALSFLMIIGMGLGTYSYGQDAPPVAPAEAAPPAGMKLIPEDLTADLNVSLYSQYIWRGYALSRGSIVIFPTITVGYKGFAVNLWADLDTRFAGSDKKEFKLQETDVTVSYSNSFAPLKLNYSLGWILYDYQPLKGESDADGNIIKDTKNQEIYLTLGLDTLLKPTFSVYQEIEFGHAWYFQLGVSHSLALFKDWSLDLAASASYLNDKSTARDFSDLHDGNISAGLKIPINKFLSIKPNLQYSFPLSAAASREIKAGSFGSHNNYVYGGLIFDLAI